MIKFDHPSYSDHPLSLYTYYYELDQKGNTQHIYVTNDSNETVYTEKYTYENNQLVKKEITGMDTSKNKTTTYFYNLLGFEIRSITICGKSKEITTKKYKNDSLIIFEKTISIPLGDLDQTRYIYKDNQLKKDIYISRSKAHRWNWITEYDTAGNITCETERDVDRKKSEHHRSILYTNKKTTYYYTQGSSDYYKVSNDYGEIDTVYIKYNEYDDRIFYHSIAWENEYLNDRSFFYIRKKCEYRDTGKDKAFNSWKKGSCFWKRAEKTKRIEFDSNGNKILNDVWEFSHVSKYEDVYEYDARGNWIKRSSYSNGELEEVIEREITYYE
jgi:YD repeat-containing protein